MFKNYCIFYKIRDISRGGRVVTHYIPGYETDYGRISTIFFFYYQHVFNTIYDMQNIWASM
jgi:hypothetical protein